MQLVRAVENKIDLEKIFLIEFDHTEFCLRRFRNENENNGKTIYCLMRVSTVVSEFKTTRALRGKIKINLNRILYCM